MFPHVFLNSPDSVHIQYSYIICNFFCKAAFLNKAVFPSVLLQMIITDKETTVSSFGLQIVQKSYETDYMTAILNRKITPKNKNPERNYAVTGDIQTVPGSLISSL